MSQLKAFEYYGVTGLPVVGAAVDVWDAVLGTPGGAPLASTTTDANGMWAFTGLTETPKDVRVTFTGRIHWYKGLTEAHLGRLLRKGIDSQVKVAAYTVLPADMEGLIVQTAAAAVTLCAANTVVSGAKIDIKSTVNGASIVRGSTDTIFGGTSGLTSLTVNMGDSYTLRSDGTSVWYVV